VCLAQFSVVTRSIVQSVIFLLAGNVNEFGAETMHKVLVKKSFGNRLLGRCSGWDDYVNIGGGKWL
jgi:hypothetical protein